MRGLPLDDFKILDDKLREHERYQPPIMIGKNCFFDAAVHIQIAEMTGNRVLKWHLKMNMEHVYLRARVDDYNTERMAKAPVEHRMLLKQMRDKNVLGSVETIRNHIRSDKSYVLDCLSRNGSAAEAYAL